MSLGTESWSEDSKISSHVQGLVTGALGSLKKQPALLAQPNLCREESLNRLHLRIHTVWQLSILKETTESNFWRFVLRAERSITRLSKEVSTYQALSTIQRSSLLHCGSF